MTPDQTQNPERSTARQRSFGRGFRQRNPLVLVAAAALAFAALFAAQAIVVRSGLTAVDEGRLLRITHDDYVHVSYRIQQLREHPPTARTIYLFGGSGTMDSFASEASLAAAVARDAGQPVQVVSLAAHQESMAMSLALIDNLPPGSALLAIGLAPTRFTGAPERDAQLLSGHTLLLRSPRLASLSKRFHLEGASPAGQLPGVFDYLGSYMRERSVSPASWGTRLQYASHYYPIGATGHSPLAKRRNVLTVLATDVGLYRRYADYNFAVLEEILKLARERGFSVALYDQPLNGSAAGPDWSGVVPAYRVRAGALAAKYGVPYLHIERAVKLTDGDFADLFHLLQPGRLKWQPEMARRLAAALDAPPRGPLATGPQAAPSPSP